jgi:hypothetical protein
MGRKREVAGARCLKHPNGHVVAQSSYETSSGRRRQYRCTPAVGERHWFSVAVTDGGVPAASWSPPPACATHPSSRVVRFGTYGKTTGKPRQRYRCFPEDGSKPHTFTPPLPREHVHEGHEQCDHCDELRGVHHGETSVARTHSWNTRTVARALEMLAAGESYAATSKWALRVSGTADRRVRTVVNEDGEIVLAADAASEARRSWHIAADWCEAFGPVVYGEVDMRLRAHALEERARLDALIDAGQPLERPQVVLLDEVPVYGRTLERRKRSRRDDGFWLLVLAEMRWPPTSDDPFALPIAPRIALRLVRAMPKANTPAWRLVFDELGYDPDFIVADAATSIASAVREHYDPSRTRLIPSLWHLTRAVEADLLRIRKATAPGADGPTLITPLGEHLHRLGRWSGVLNDAASWSTWWDELIGLLRTHRLPVEKALGHRARYEPTMAAALAFAPPQVHVATGGLETLIDSQVKRLLTPRRTAFGNIERTNILFDLVVARQHGAFDNLGATAALIRDDTLANDGYTVALRSVADPRPPGGSYSSLRDVTLLNEAARRRGLL